MCPDPVLALILPLCSFSTCSANLSLIFPGFPPLLLLFLRCLLGSLSLAPGFNYHLGANDSQSYISSLALYLSSRSVFPTVYLSSPLVCLKGPSNSVCQHESSSELCSLPVFPVLVNGITIQIAKCHPQNSLFLHHIHSLPNVIKFTSSKHVGIHHFSLFPSECPNQSCHHLLIGLRQQP